LKRSPLPQRKTPLKRAPLKAPTIEQVRAWSSKPRKAIAKIGPKAKREAAALEAFRHDVKERARGMCEAPWGGYKRDPQRPMREIPIYAHHSSMTYHAGEHAHHMWPEDRDCGIHDPARGLFVCAVVHDWLHKHPDDAKALGLLRPDPRQ